MKLYTPRLTTFVAVMSLLVNAGCVHKFVVNKVADALSQSGTVFSRDEDPDLIEIAVPFTLKFMENILEETPRHDRLLLATSRGFTQFAYGFVQQEADKLEDRDLTASITKRDRARALYLRARDYGMRSIEARHKGFTKALREDPKAAVSRLSTKSDVEFLYWTAASLGAAIAISKDRPELLGDQSVVEALIDRALALDSSSRKSAASAILIPPGKNGKGCVKPSFENGAIHSFLISYESSRQGEGSEGDAMERSRNHFECAVLLTDGKLGSPYVALAEAVSVQSQNRAEFESLLNLALAIKVNERDEWRLENILMQRRARWLLGRIDELFAN